MWENSTQEAERRNGIITDKVIMTSFGPLALSVLLLTFVTLDKSKCHRGISGNETKIDI